MKWHETNQKKKDKKKELGDRIKKKYNKPMNKIKYI